MPDLGKYADAVLSAYAVSLLLLVGIGVTVTSCPARSRISRAKPAQLTGSPVFVA